MEENFEDRQSKLARFLSIAIAKFHSLSEKELMIGLVLLLFCVMSLIFFIENVLSYNARQVLSAKSNLSIPLSPTVSQDQADLQVSEDVTDTPEADNLATPTSTPSATLTPTTTLTPIAHPTSTPGPTATNTSTPSATSTTTASPTPNNTPTSTPTPTNTLTPTPIDTSTPVPTSTPI